MVHYHGHALLCWRRRSEMANAGARLGATDKLCCVPRSVLPINVVCPGHDQWLILSVPEKRSHVIEDLITCRLTFTPALVMVDGSGEF